MKNSSSFFTVKKDPQQILKLVNVTRTYDGNFQALRDVNFTVFRGELVSIIGPSGSGKTTILRIINGLDWKNYTGDVIFKNKNINVFPPELRLGINTVFQESDLFPHLNNYENVSYGLKARGIKDNNFILKEVNKYLKIVSLENILHRYPNSLSGGEQQRVSLARALINHPDLLLIDELFSAVDPNMKRVMFKKIRQIKDILGITFLMVTHDQKEALSISDRVFVIRKGIIQQIGTPLEIYNEPDNVWVAKFVGESNIISDGIFIKDNLLKIDGMFVKCVDSGFGNNEKRIDILIRPEDIEINLLKNSNDKIVIFTGEVIQSTFCGVHWEIEIKTTKRIFLVHSTKCFFIGAKVSLSFVPEDIHVMWKMDE